MCLNDNHQENFVEYLKPPTNMLAPSQMTPLTPILPLYLSHIFKLFEHVFLQSNSTNTYALRLVVTLDKFAVNLTECPGEKSGEERNTEERRWSQWISLEHRRGRDTFIWNLWYAACWLVEVRIRQRCLEALGGRGNNKGTIKIG